jgi:phage-related protein (TIGR01555 family)
VGTMARMFDGLRNILSGLGGQGDKATGATYTLAIPNRAAIDACYRGTWLGRKIHDIPALDMTREWRGWQADDNQIEAIEATETRLQLRMKVRRAIVLARLYGGSAIIMGLPGDMSQPAPPKIAKGQLRYLHLVHRHQLTLGDPDLDLMSAGFGRPTMFRLTANTKQVAPDIHPSRVVAFTGNQLPDGSMGAGVEDWFWGDPLLAAVFDALTSHDTGIAAITAMMNEAKVDIVHVPGLMDQLSSTEYEQRLIERFNIAALLKSITNTLVLDGGDGSDGAGEQWEQRQVRWEGLPEIQQTLFHLVSGAADIPATRLIGQAPHGLNATGESDTRNYYDMLSSLQNSDVGPTLAPLDDYLIMDATGGRDPSIFYNWNPLWQLTPKDKAERDKLVSETAKNYADMGVVPDDAFAAAVQNRLIEDGTFPGLEAAIEEAQQQATLELPPQERTGAVPPPAANDPGAQQPPEAMAGNSSRRAANDRARRYIRDRAGSRPEPGELLLTDAVPRTLYVSRKVLNAAEVVAWAERQGFKNIVPAASMHVTVIASREPVDWLKIDPAWTGPDNDGTLTVPPGGPRVVEPLGPNDAPVLLFSSWELSYRHGLMREAGASWDFDSYQPHVTVSYDKPADGFDYDKVEPFTGQLRLGPEIFEPFDGDWSPEAEAIAAE